MKTAAEYQAVLDEAVARHEGFNWAPMRPADLDGISILIRNLQAELAAAHARACHCGEVAGFSLEAHLSAPSRERPVMAAAGVNILKAARNAAASVA